MKRLYRHILPAIATSFVLLSGYAQAMGGSNDEPVPPTCPKAQIYDSKTKTCMVDKGGMIGDESRTDYAYALAKAGRYQEALDMLNTLKDQNTAEALNYRGYATRKLGRTDEGISYYLKSVALDPKYPKVREYLGEAYMIKNRPDLAREQLAAIKTLCGTRCEEYRDLSAAIDGHPES
ncbi:tetratricopeptide repeat protein [Buttiauxella sp.]|uniref:tetratricopeptide repeat protein n=1 Tax=Buttiauxella sp. TaxID=1972222 RepID=UPI003C74673C